MKVYELMSLLGQTRADKDVRIGVCLTICELTSGEQIGKDRFCLNLDVGDFDAEFGNIRTSF